MIKNMFKKMGNLFYKKEITADHKIKRILGIKFKKKLAPVSAIEKFFLFPPYPSRRSVQTPFSAAGITEQCNIAPSKIGKWSYTQRDLWVVSPETTIGAFCSIGCRVVLGHGEHPVSFLSTSPYFYFDELGFKIPSNHNGSPAHPEFWALSPIKIGNDVWIGDGVFIKNGVTIGDGAIIGARAVVTKDVPPYAVVVGVPAKVIKYRFPPEVIEELLALKWWELPDKTIQQIPYDNLPEALKFLRKVREAQ